VGVPEGGKLPMTRIPHNTTALQEKCPGDWEDCTRPLGAELLSDAPSCCGGTVDLPPSLRPLAPPPGGVPTPGADWPRAGFQWCLRLLLYSLHGRREEKGAFGTHTRMNATKQGLPFASQRDFQRKQNQIPSDPESDGP